MWYRKNVGRRPVPDRRHLVADRDGGHPHHAAPGHHVDQAGRRDDARSPGSAPTIVDNDGTSVGNGEGGYLVITEPWPGMLRGIWGDPERYRETYWSRFPGRYFAGDGAKRDEDGDLWLLGRIDDVMNISGHRISTTEVEHALVGHPEGRRGGRRRGIGPDHRPGDRGIRHAEGRCASQNADGGRRARRGASRRTWPRRSAPIAKPREILLTPELPKTRSGKIMRRLLRDVAENRELGDVTTLMDPTVVNMIDEKMRAASTDEES